MTTRNEQMIEEIREKLNLVNQSLIDPEKYKTANEEEVQEIHEYVTSKILLLQVKQRLLQMHLGNFANKQRSVLI